jgi:hypothetical protein
VTFSLSAVGTADQVRKQLDAADLTHSGDLGLTVRSFLAEEVLGSISGHSSHPSHVLNFVVEASGHGDQSSLNLNITVRPMWVPAVEAPKDDA